MKNELQKLEVLQKKIDVLQIKRSKIQQKVVVQFSEIFEKHAMLALDFDVLFGCLLDGIETMKSQGPIVERWRVQGKKFRSATRVKGRRAKLKASET